MSGKGKFTIAALLAVVLFTAFGLLQLFALRFEQGDMFPPYSSLRSDPLGSKALFKALAASTGLEVRRNFRDLDKLKGEKGQTIYWLGADEALLQSGSQRQLKDLETLAGEGNRLVIAFGRGKERAAADQGEPEKCDDQGGPEKGDDQGGPEKGDDQDRKGVPAEEAVPTEAGPGSAVVWGVQLGSFDLPAAPAEGRPMARLEAPAFELPGTIPLHSRRHFQDGGEEWRPVYSYSGQAVVLERAVGKGSIVLLADSYLFSNEAMHSDRCPGLLAWLQGASRSALFDESHLGVYDKPGIMTLIIKHRLVPFLLALIALAALYLWKSAVPFHLAAGELERQEQEVRDNFSGLVNLLRRNIAAGELLGTCFQQWLHSFSREMRQSPELARQLEAALADEGAKPAGKRDPVAAYRKMAGLLSGFRAR